MYYIFIYIFALFFYTCIKTVVAIAVLVINLSCYFQVTSSISSNRYYVNSVKLLQFQQTGALLAVTMLYLTAYLINKNG